MVSFPKFNHFIHRSHNNLVHFYFIAYPEGGGYPIVYFDGAKL
uniref:Uncharacterized protein n=1 Tax=Solanum lycopersicum TaxID=4081 RepID=K4CTE8_SOLLC